MGEARVEIETYKYKYKSLEANCKRKIYKLFKLRKKE